MLNKVMLIGRLGKDPVIRYTKSGDPVANFSVATEQSWKDKGGNKQVKTEWHNVVAFGKQAEFVQKYLGRGKPVYLEGSLQTRDWTDNQNVKHYRTEIVARMFAFLPSERNAGNGSDAAQEPGYGGGDAAGEPAGQGYVNDDMPF